MATTRLLTSHACDAKPFLTRRAPTYLGPHFPQDHFDASHSPVRPDKWQLLKPDYREVVRVILPDELQKFLVVLLVSIEIFGGVIRRPQSSFVGKHPIVFSEILEDVRDGIEVLPVG